MPSILRTDFSSALDTSALTTQTAHADAALRLEDVRPEGLATTQTTGAGDLDALGGALVRLHLRHYVIPLRLLLRLGR